MEKNINVNKINVLGKVGRIIASICRILMIIGFVGCVIGMIACMILPKDLLNIKYNSSAKVTVDLDSLASKPMFKITTEDIEKIVKENNSGNISLNEKEYGVEGVTIDGHKVVVNGETTDNRTFNLRSVVAITATAAVYLACLYVTLTFVSRLFSALEKCDTPFEEVVIKRISYVIYAIIPYVVINPLLSAIVGYSCGESDSLSFSINFGFLFAILILICLSSVFKYGAALQKESDETL